MTSPTTGVTVGAFLRGRTEALGLGLKLLAGASGLDRLITSPYAQKTGLALAGFEEYLRPGRIVIYGESEIRFLESLSPHERRGTITRSFSRDVPWETGQEYERLGLDDLSYDILGLKVPLVRMPVAPGRSVATLVEVAARTQLLRARGHHAARNLAAKVGRQLGRPVRSPRSDLDGSIEANDDALESEPEGGEP